MSVQRLLGHSSPETTMVYVHAASPSMIAVESPYDEQINGPAQQFLPKIE